MSSGPDLGFPPPLAFPYSKYIHALKWKHLSIFCVLLISALAAKVVIVIANVAILCVMHYCDHPKAINVYGVRSIIVIIQRL